MIKQYNWLKYIIVSFVLSISILIITLYLQHTLTLQMIKKNSIICSYLYTNFVFYSSLIILIVNTILVAFYFYNRKKHSIKKINIFLILLLVIISPFIYSRIQWFILHEYYQYQKNTKPDIFTCTIKNGVIIK